MDKNFIKVSSVKQNSQKVNSPAVDIRGQNPKLTDGLRQGSSKIAMPRKNFWTLLGILFAVVVLLIGLFIYQRIELNSIKNDLEKQQVDPTAKIREESNELISEVGKLIVLPSDEDPTIATVNDLEKLKDQPFFANAQLGDKVLIYTKASKAILYRPSEHKIIELAPLNTGISNSSS
jgi:hypothetical protein